MERFVLRVVPIVLHGACSWAWCLRKITRVRRIPGEYWLQWVKRVNRRSRCIYKQGSRVPPFIGETQWWRTSQLVGRTDDWKNVSGWQHLVLPIEA
eukprot:11195568-Lingulodinium_polyedra.AAC.1